MFVDFRLVLWGKDESDTRSIIDICEQKILFGYLPIMSDSGTFVADGVECEFGSPSIEGKILKDLYQEGLHIMSADIENTMNSLEDYNGIFPYDLLNGSPLTKAVDEFTNALQPVRHR